MRRFKFEFPTEWSLCPDGVQDEVEQPAPEASGKDEAPTTADPGGKPRVLAAGVFEPSSM